VGFVYIRRRAQLHKVCIYVADAGRGVRIGHVGTAPFRRRLGRVSTACREKMGYLPPGGVELHAAPAHADVHSMHESCTSVARADARGAGIATPFYSLRFRFFHVSLPTPGPALGACAKRCAWRAENLRIPSAHGVAHGVKRMAGKICKIYKSKVSPNAQIQKKKSSALVFGGKPLMGAVLIKKV